MTNNVLKIKDDVTHKPINFKTKKIKNMTDCEKRRLFSSSNYNFISALLSDIILCSINRTSDFEKEWKHAELRVKNMLSSILSGNGIETMVAAQMLVIHNLQIKMASHTTHTPLPHPCAVSSMNTVNKLANTFVQQAQLLNKLQGKGQQKVTVEHVNIHAGGQAIVGDVHQDGGIKNANKN